MFVLFLGGLIGVIGGGIRAMAHFFIICDDRADADFNGLPQRLE